jgi:murein DD-endopeptidase MepM/ murein hydrolase activator NlpD
MERIALKRTNWQQPVALSTQKVDPSSGVLGSPQSYLPSVSPRNAKLPLLFGSACLGVVASLFVPAQARAATNQGDFGSPVLTSPEMFLGRSDTPVVSDSATQFVVVPATTLAVLPNELSFSSLPDATLPQGVVLETPSAIDSSNPAPVPQNVTVLQVPALSTRPTAKPMHPSLDLLGISSSFGNGLLSASGLGRNLLASSDLLASSELSRRQSFTTVDQLLADPLAPAPILPYEPTLPTTVPVTTAKPAPAASAPVTPAAPVVYPPVMTVAPLPTPSANLPVPNLPIANPPVATTPVASAPSWAPVTVAAPIAPRPVAAPVIAPTAAVAPAPVTVPVANTNSYSAPATVPAAVSAPTAPAPTVTTVDPFSSPSPRIAAAPVTSARTTRNPLTQAIDLQIIAPIARRINIPRMPSLDLPPLPGAERLLPGGDSQFGDPSLTQQFAWPAKGVFTSGYGPRWGRMHRGIDIAGPVGTPIFAAAEGVVVRSEWSSGGFGNLVTLQHADGSRTLYAHNNRLLVSPGQQVRQGEQIAEMGSTGRSTGPHLHFEVHPAGRGAVNPMAFLGRSFN